MNEHDISKWREMTRQLADFLCIALASPNLFGTDTVAYEKASQVRKLLGGPVDDGAMDFYHHWDEYKNGKQD